jgi:hypothetical protein
MNRVERRTVLKTMAMVVAVAPASAALLTLAPAYVQLRVLLDEKGARVPADFTGLSYESSQLAHPSFFSTENHALVELFRTLGDSGVLRIGGNMSEYTVWSPQDAAVDAAVGDTEGPDPGNGSTRTYTITPRAIDNLAEFLKATGWRLLYGLNLARETPETVLDEAAYVTHRVGTGLVAFQFGNEPDLFKHPANGSFWTYEEYIAKWRQMRQALLQRVPGAAVAGPDTSHKLEWAKRFASDAGGEIAMLTTHYYAEGPPTDPRMTVDFLPHPGQQLQIKVLEPMAAARQEGLAYRMSEGNSCYNAGKRGVSDTFAAALWVVDFMLTVAQGGGIGVNLHGGGDGLYTPIAGSALAGYTARPIFYGMLLAKQFMGLSMVKTELQAEGRNVVAYAGAGKRRALIAVINRDSSPAEIAIAVPAKLQGEASVWRLAAPAIDSTHDVRFGDGRVSAAGNWQPSSREELSLSSGKAMLSLPPYSAALVIGRRRGRNDM